MPLDPLSGMRNKYNHKVRLTFKLELDQVWIGTPGTSAASWAICRNISISERTEKVAMSQIRTIVSEPIESHEQYHVMVLVILLVLSFFDYFTFFRCCRVSSWALPNSRAIGFIGCLLSTWTPSNAPSLDPDRILLVIFLTCTAHSVIRSI